MVRICAITTHASIVVDLRDQVQKKIDKFLEPPPVKAPKPLPRPDDAPRKKRGGRRYLVTCAALCFAHFMSCSLRQC